MCLLFAFEIIILCEAEAFKNRIWYFKTWEDVAWQPVVGMQGTSVVFLYQPSIAVFWKSPSPTAHLVGLSVTVQSPPPGQRMLSHHNQANWKFFLLGEKWWETRGQNTWN